MKQKSKMTGLFLEDIVLNVGGMYMKQKRFLCMFVIGFIFIHFVLQVYHLKCIRIFLLPVFLFVCLFVYSFVVVVLVPLCLFSECSFDLPCTFFLIFYEILVKSCCRCQYMWYDLLETPNYPLPHLKAQDWSCHWFICIASKIKSIQQHSIHPTRGNSVESSVFTCAEILCVDAHHMENPPRPDWYLPCYRWTMFTFWTSLKI